MGINLQEAGLEIERVEKQSNLKTGKQIWAKPSNLPE